MTATVKSTSSLVMHIGGLMRNTCSTAPRKKKQKQKEIHYAVTARSDSSARCETSDGDRVSPTRMIDTCSIIQPSGSIRTPMEITVRVRLTKEKTRPGSRNKKKPPNTSTWYERTRFRFEAQIKKNNNNVTSWHQWTWLVDWWTN